MLKNITTISGILFWRCDDEEITEAVGRWGVAQVVGGKYGVVNIVLLSLLSRLGSIGSLWGWLRRGLVDKWITLSHITQT